MESLGHSWACGKADGQYWFVFTKPNTREWLDDINHERLEWAVCLAALRAKGIEVR